MPSPKLDLDTGDLHGIYLVTKLGLVMPVSQARDRVARVECNASRHTP
jgi:hypothetical protein